MLLLAAAFLVAFVLLLYMVSPLISPKPLALPGAHVVVSGLLLLRRPLPARSVAPSPSSGVPAREAGGPPTSLSPNGGPPAAVQPGTVSAEGLGDPPSAAPGSSRGPRARQRGQRQRAGSRRSRGPERSLIPGASLG